MKTAIQVVESPGYHPYKPVIHHDTREDFTVYQPGEIVQRWYALQAMQGIHRHGVGISTMSPVVRESSRPSHCGALIEPARCSPCPFEHSSLRC